jgi:NtrC-family two-component system sensor histidine kinase KinB
VIGFPRLTARFLLASLVLVATTVICGVWSSFTFARLSGAVDASLRQSQKTIELASTLGTSLEREDDALLLSLAGNLKTARADLERERRLFDQKLAELKPRLTEADELEASRVLERHVKEYRGLGDELLAAVGQPDARDLYHRRVNPALRRAVSSAGEIREINFREMQAAGIRARDEANSAKRVVALVSVAALALSTLVSLHLTRTVVRPIRTLTKSVDAVRLGDFEQRIEVVSADELGQLASGFNRMSERLAEFHRLNIEAVVRAKETLEATLAALPDAVFVIDPDRRVASMNQIAEKLTKTVFNKLVKTADDLPLPASGRAALESALRGEVKLEGRADLKRALAVTIDGKKRQLQPLAIPIAQFSAGRAGAVVVLYDVTDFARLDELRSELVAVASHELKTPLTTLRMTLMMLGERNDGRAPRERELLAQALLGCEELAKSIEEMLDLTRVEAGQLRLSLDRLDAGVLVEQAQRPYRGRFEEARIALTVVRGEDAAILRGDATRLGVVLSNLLSNALKYSPAESEVTIAIAPRAKDRIEISVADRGPGVPEQFRERVFEKFFRVEHHIEGAHPRPPGAGFGLYLCRQIVEAHGGTIRCESGPDGRGARLVVELPAETVREPTPVP